MHHPSVTPRPALGCALFPTPIGACAVAWSARGLVRLQLPEDTDARTLAIVRASVLLPEGAEEAAPPAPVKAALARIVKLLDGKREDLSSIALDLEGLPPFHRKVYEAMRHISPGEIRTYRELAEGAGSPLASRAVGQAMAKNPLPIVIPCHRVVAAGGKPGGFSANGGLDTKAKLLAIEGATLPT